MFLGELAINLLAALLGFLASRLYLYLKEYYSKRNLRWFWVPPDAKKINLYCGRREEQLLLNEGEVEPLINLQDALSMAELKSFLDQFYSEVIIVFEEAGIDWTYPVISLGGPLVNSLTKQVGEQNLLPLWFLDLPYTKDSKRSIGDKNRTEVFKSAFNGDELISDVGLVARMKYPKFPQTYLFVLASNYGTGTHGIIKYLTSTKKLDELHSMCKKNNSTYFQAIIQTYTSRNRIVDAERLRFKKLE